MLQDMILKKLATDQSDCSILPNYGVNYSFSI